MTTISGQHVIHPAGGAVTPSLSPAMQGFALDYWPPHAAAISIMPAGTLTTHWPVSMTPRALSGQRVRSYLLDYYYHLYIKPASLDLGNLLSEQTRTVTFWNSYFEPVTVTGFSTSGVDGITITPPAGYEAVPFVLRSLQEITYEVTISLVGPPAINANVQWETDHGDVTLSITGSRVILFPFLPTWEAGAEETLVAQSSLARTRNGTEQSVAYRSRLRRSFSFNYTLLTLDAQRFDNLLFGWQSRLYGLPLWTEQGRTTAALASGSDTINAPTFGRSFAPGMLVMIFSGKTPVDSETRQVVSTTSSSIKVNLPFAFDWPKGARVVPVALAAAQPDLTGARLSDGVLQASVLFECEPSTTDPNAVAVAPDALYNGYEIYLGRTNWREGSQFTFQADVQKLDTGTGIFALKSQSGFSPQGRSHDWQFKTLDQVLLFRQWLARRKGKTIGVWMPNAYTDFNLAAVASAGQTNLRVVTNGYTLMSGNNPARRDIFILMRDGSWFARRIVSTSDASGVTTLILDATLTETLTTENVKQISFLQFYRMASDEAKIRWYVPGVAEATTGLISTKALA